MDQVKEGRAIWPCESTKIHTRKTNNPTKYLLIIYVGSQSALFVRDIMGLMYSKDINAMFWKGHVQMGASKTIIINWILVLL